MMIWTTTASESASVRTMTEMTVSLRKPPEAAPPAMAPRPVGPGFQIVIPPHLAGEFGLPRTKASRVIRCRRTDAAS
jgi:hypothetical protein